MTSVITLLTIITSLMSPVDSKPAYYQEYNLVGETPDILVSSITNDKDMTPVVMMPEIVVSASKPMVKNNSIEFPEVVITASSINPVENMTGVIMMPEIVVTGKRISTDNVGIAGPKQSSKKGSKNV
jgi:hypothetical protein